ncbi:hypothetical protein C2G38_2181910 [Gigaspora rosea]|uniref:Uncharacterized protein n=1 Tax=Gigaspora rosea TaxID=44941 RepID=A0A397VAG9_9GLOM|nr:hypothetical protein C2G38_2181910 [Gigaspora rosea]
MFRFRFNTEPEPEPELDLSSVQFRTLLFKPESNDTFFVEDDEDIMQTSIKYILENIDVNEIEEIWAIHVITTSKFCHFVILLSDKTYPYYVAAQFSESHSQDLPTESIRCNINKLFTPIADLRNEMKENINERKLYRELWGVARNITQKAVQLHRQDILEKLQNLLTEIQENESINSLDNINNEEICSNSDNNLHDNEEYNENNP